MPQQQSSSVREPCSNCREKHLKCDNRRPKCRPCQTKGLDCARVPKKAIFRHWSAADSASSFPRDQIWVNSKRNTRRRSSADNLTLSPSRPAVHRPISASQGHTSVSTHPSAQVASVSPQRVLPISGAGPNRLSHSPAITHASLSPSTCDQRVYLSPFRVVSRSEESSGGIYHSSKETACSAVNTRSDASISIAIDDGRNHREGDASTLRPIDDIQEACLLRFFAEEIAPWFDQCDEHRHFQLSVPRRARSCVPLRDAICSVASLYLSRLPHHATPDGVVYQGQLLPHLTSYTTVEYMLKCIPALSSFPDARDIEYQENIMAAAVILRQCEEMNEDEDERDWDMLGDGGGHVAHQVNFLHIIRAIIETTVPSSTHSSLANAVFWVAVRQEIYHFAVRQQAPRIRPDAEKRKNASAINKLVIHLGDVASWLWGEKLYHEWVRLDAEQRELTQNCLSQFIPILEREANKASGEIFPVVWYHGDGERTAVQFFELARAMMLAENPNLRHAPHYRAAHRKAEAQVRSIVLRICGIALGHSKSPPALLIAIVGIMMYGEYFTDSREREALMGVLERTKSFHAWSMHNATGTLKQRWESIDSEE